MPAGRLRKRVQFDKPGLVPDGGGGFTAGWAEQFKVWGGFRPERGRERLEADRLQAEVAGVLTVRSSDQTRTIKEDWRAVIGGVDYVIRAITNPDQRGKYLEILVERGAAQPG